MRILENRHRLDLRGLSWWERALLRTLQFSAATWHQARRDRILIRASGLAYSSLLAAVPLVAVGFALLSAVGAFDDVKLKVQKLLFSLFLPASHDEIAFYLDQFAGGAGKLGLVGFLFLVLTAVLLFDGIEASFNQVWHVRDRRRLVFKLSTYTSVLIFGTLLIGASLTISARIKTALFRGLLVDVGTIERIGSWLFPFVLTCLAFWLMYVVIPYTRVRRTSGLAGALFAGVLFELAKNLFASLVGRSVRYSALYGSLALVPIFLIWLYVTWIIVLIGLEVAFVHQHFAALVRSGARGERDLEMRPVVGLQLFLQLAHRFDSSRDPPTIDELSSRFLVATGVVESHLRCLVDAGLARWVESGAGETGVMPARPLDSLRVREVIEVFLPPDDEEFRQRPIELVTLSVLEEVRKAGFAAVGETTVRDLLLRLGEPAASGGTPSVPR
ncbi:MAG: YihY family inner membrane protein [Thermoanaerobaculales bacterium]|nr:YihY family inner membrane protein [Thermoanaerobaculales bacterium]